MDLSSPPSALRLLESQVRECFGRVVYTHKAHEKSADLTLDRLRIIKTAQIVLSAVTTAGLLAILVGRPETSRIAAVVSAVVSTVLLALNTYTRQTDLGQVAERHKEAADRLWAIRESYLSLITDIRAGLVDCGTIQARRDELQQLLAAICEGAPRTVAAGYSAASDALKHREELTFSDEEIDRFLPRDLRKASAPPAT